MPRERVGETSIGNRTCVTHTADTDLIVSQNMVNIVDITVAAPSVGGCLHF